MKTRREEEVSFVYCYDFADKRYLLCFKIFFFSDVKELIVLYVHLQDIQIENFVKRFFEKKEQSLFF